MIKIIISEDLIKKVKGIDLLTYLETFEPDELVRLSDNLYCTRTHDSLKISNGLWMWWSKGIGGKTALDYLIKVKDMDFKDAVMLLAEKNNIYIEHIKNENHIKRKNNCKDKFVLPEHAETDEKIISYLKKRGISETVIQSFIEKGLIFQSKYNDNVVFVGVDENEKPKFACMRGTGEKKFFQEVRGSDKTYSFRFVKNKTEELHLFESAIDLLSYLTITEVKGSDLKNQSLISLSGIYSPKSEDSIPSSLSEYLRKNSQVKEIHLHLDKDEAGLNATKALMKMLGDKYKVSYHFVPVGKDVNDYLIYFKNKIKERDVCR